MLQLFIYLIAPLINQVKESDLVNNGLESGMKMWQAFWDIRTPNIPCFSAHCKPKPKSIWYNLKRLSQGNFKSIFFFNINSVFYILNNRRFNC